MRVGGFICWEENIRAMTVGDDPEGGVNRRRALTIGGAAAVTALSAMGLPTSGSESEEGEGNESPVEQVHAAGVTGEGVRVGVLDTTGFAPSHPALDERVTALRSFDSAPLVVDRVSHGTAAAATVTELAPDAELLLASFARPSGFAAALEWLAREGADVVLAPVAAHGSDGMDSTVVRAASAAVDAGVHVVAPTGNAAQGHWSGPLGAGVGKTLAVRPLSTEGSLRGQLAAWLTRPADDIDLTLRLVRLTATGDGRDLIALSQSSEWGRAERLKADLSPGEYVLEIGIAGRDGVPAGVHERPVSVVTPTHAVAPARSAGSIAAPASTPGVVAVGALADDGIADYSGRGPTADGRTGVDIVSEPGSWAAGGTPGTSGAAARAAGTVALVTAADPSLAPAELRALLRDTAADVGRDGPDFAAGWGRLDPLASVQQARVDH